MGAKIDITLFYLAKNIPARFPYNPIHLFCIQFFVYLTIAETIALL